MCIIDNFKNMHNMILSMIQGHYMILYKRLKNE